MKLIQRTYRLTLLALIPVFLLGGVYSYLMMRHVIYEETDEYLTYEMTRLLEYHRRHQALPDLHMVTDVIEGVAYPLPVFRDTLILEPGDNEMVPYRQLFFSIEHKGQPFTIVLRHLLVGDDDILQGALLIILGLMLLLTAALFLVVARASGHVWKPFHRTLSTLVGFSIHRPLPEFPRTGVREFDTLNDTASGLLRKIAADFRRTKEFNENASHELQTQLAVIRASAETLINDPEGRFADNPELARIYNAAVRLSRTERSLLLLSRIGNLEFDDRVDLDLSSVVEQAMEPFAEVIRLRDIHLHAELGNCPVRMDAGLAEILVNNLLKNAVKHNLEGGHIRITLDTRSLTVANSGLPHRGDTDRLVERFGTGPLGDSGIGLAIVKQICDLYGFPLDYTVSEANEHFLTVRFSTAADSQIPPE